MFSRSGRPCLVGVRSSAPGPGHYNQEHPTKKSIASTVNTARGVSSFGSGVHHEGPRIKGCSQGPASYDIAPLSTGVAASFGSSHKGPNVGTTPGPGHYNLREQSIAASNGGIGHSGAGAFGSSVADAHRPPKLHGNAPETVGPGSYELTAAHMARSAAAEFGSPHPPLKQSRVPGPGHYESFKNVVGSSPSSVVPGFGYSKATEAPRVHGVAPLAGDGKALVGPGAYETPRGIADANKGPSFGAPRQAANVTETPAPGSYEVTSISSNVPSSKGFGAGPATKGPSVIGAAPIGPGQYQTPQGLGEAKVKGGNAGFGRGHEEIKSNNVPAPGKYDPPPRSAARGVASGFGLGPATEGPKVHGGATEAAGPGAYETNLGIADTKPKGPGFGSGHKGPATINTPAPGAYEHDVGPSQLTGSGRGFGAVAKTVVPVSAGCAPETVGPGAYNHSGMADAAGKGSSFGAPFKAVQGSEAPGPGSYEMNRDIHDDRNSGFGLGAKTVVPKIAGSVPEVVGPGAYNHSSLGDGPVKGSSFGAPFKPQKGTGGPGPGHYELREATERGVASGFGLGAKTAMPVSNGSVPETVGPGAYNHSGMADAAGKGSSFGAPFKAVQGSEAPGPGSYEMNREIHNDQNSGFGLGAKTVVPKIAGSVPEVVGPGAYNHSSLGDGPVKGSSFGVPFKPQKGTGAPGPGHYELSRELKEGGTAAGFGLGAKTVLPVSAGSAPESVGPGAYNHSSMGELAKGSTFGGPYKQPAVAAAPAPGSYDHGSFTDSPPKGMGFGSTSQHEGPAIHGATPATVGPGAHDTPRGIGHPEVHVPVR